ncbi:MAG: MATE family efflux transporter [Bacteroidales bacterium]|jgi:putative MATE family efflux protein|nr:MATE family efflux transporter [Bacteroidales bacterium]HOA10381.1 MATE family efflux transporter [Tenuifilaceae bacterium]MBP8642474.1 MATE family efflux transporter [Bacteroidales bacterium]HOG71599.1 MATE family efflux transporter [Tenuifilaceae bacterium]HOW20072.1 MATE family efflux transporter [Tenuifilaceae bacterium]
MRDFTTGSETQHILRFATPMLIGDIFQQLYNVVDSIIVGRFIGDKALAAVGASFPVIFVIIALVLGIGIGSTVVISQYFGARNFDMVKRAANTIYIFLLISGVVVTAIGLMASGAIFRMLHLPEELMKPARTYLNIFMLGMVVMFAFNAIASILRGIGDSKTPLYFLLISTLTNVGLVLLFVVKFRWGIAGAAWATVISQVVAFIIALIYLNHSQHMLSINLRTMKFDRQIFRQIVKIGLPTGIQQTMVALGSMAMMGIVNSFGTTVIAAFTVASRLDALIATPIMDFAAALSGFVGQNIGANKIDRVKRGLRSTLKISISFCVVNIAIILIFGHSLMGIFTKSSDVIAIGYQYLLVVSLFYIIFAVMFSINGLLRGVGAAVVPMYITLLSLWIFRIPLAYLLSKTFGMGALGIWWSIPIGWTMGAIAAVAYYRHGSWKNKSLVKVRQQAAD